MTLQSCEHPDSFVVHTAGECPLCQALSDLTDAQQRTDLSDLCREAITMLREGPFDEATLQQAGRRLAYQLGKLMHDADIREQME